MRSIELRGRHALVVDDSATNREILRNQLRSWGLEVSAAEDGPAALATLQSAAECDTRFDVVVVDMHMPAMDGIELARALRDEAPEPTPRIVMLTSVSFTRSAELRDAGIDQALTKPVRRRELRAALEGVDTEAPMSVGIREGRGSERFDLDVVLAEDNRVNQRVAVSMLERLGCRVRVAGNGEEVLDLLETMQPDLVFMDCQMPVLDGFDATRRIRAGEGALAAARSVPIVALTANAMAGDRARCLAAGMNDYLSKPFTKREIAGVLDRWADRAVEEAPEPERVTGPSGATLDPGVLEELRSLEVEGQPSLLAELIEEFLPDAARRVGEIRDAIDASDLERVRDEAHALKSSSAHVGARQLSQLAAALEARAREDALDRARVLAEELAETHAAAAKALEEIASREAER